MPRKASGKLMKVVGSLGIAMRSQRKADARFMGYVYLRILVPQLA